MKVETIRRDVRTRVEELLQIPDAQCKSPQPVPQVAAELRRIEEDPSFAAVIRAFTAYKLSRKADDLRALQKALDGWLKPTNELRRRWTSTETYSDPIHAIYVWSLDQGGKEREQNRVSYERARPAAQTVFDRYGEAMPEDYRNALRITFLDKTAADHFYCVRYYPKDFHPHIDKVAPELRNRGISNQAVNGYTPTKAPTEEDGKNVSGIHPPVNRRIEFYEGTNPHTMVHEMLHWICHEKFRTHASGGYSDYVREGLTESLARHALNEFDNGGYQDYFPAALDAINGNKPSWAAVYGAYFRGEDIEPTARMFLASREERMRSGLRRNQKECCGCTLL